MVAANCNAFGSYVLCVTQGTQHNTCTLASEGQKRCNSAREQRQCLEITADDSRMYWRLKCWYICFVSVF